MIIAITGPCSTGKTTTINKILERGSLAGYRKIVMLKESIRDLFEREFSSLAESHAKLFENEELALKWTEKVSELYTKDFYQEVLKNNDSDTLVILDRCHLDSIIYAFINTMRHTNILKCLVETIESYLNVGNYVDLIFLTEAAEGIYQDDGFRHTNDMYIRRFEDGMFKIVFEGKATLLPYDIKDRIEVIEKKIIEYKANMR